MNILIVAATEAEIGPLISNIEYPISNIEIASPQPSPKERESLGNVSHLTSHVSYLITGVGMVATAFALGNHLANNKYDLVINLGITGSFDSNIALGEVVEVIEDTFAELGAEDDEQFIPMNDMGFDEVTFKPNGHPFLNIKQVRAITVNKVHGNEVSIQKIVERLGPQVESMGGGCSVLCLQTGSGCLRADQGGVKLCRKA